MTTKKVNLTTEAVRKIVRDELSIYSLSQEATMRGVEWSEIDKNKIKSQFNVFCNILAGRYSRTPLSIKYRIREVLKEESI